MRMHLFVRLETETYRSTRMRDVSPALLPPGRPES